MLKALGVKGLSWLTRLFKGVANRGGRSRVHKVNQSVCANYRGITLLSLPGKSLLQGGGKGGFGR